MNSKSLKKEIESIAKQILDSSLEDIMDIFGPDIQYVDPQVQSQLSQLVDRTGKVGEWVTFSVLNMNKIEEEIARGGEYLIWETAEDELVCPFCGPIHNKMVRADDLLSLGIPPAHTNCRCRLITVEERYGELKPIVYYYQLPYEYEEWRNSGKPDYTLSETERVWLFVQRTLELNKHIKFLETKRVKKDDIPSSAERESVQAPS